MLIDFLFYYIILYYSALYHTILCDSTFYGISTPQGDWALWPWPPLPSTGGSRTSGRLGVWRFRVAGLGVRGIGFRGLGFRV